MARHARGNGQRNVAAPEQAASQWVPPDSATFINVSLNDADKQWLQAELDQLWFHVDALLIDAEKHGARVSIVPDTKSGRYNATFTAYDRESARYGLILSVRAATPTLAMFALAYSTLHKSDAWVKAASSPKDMFG